MATMRDISFRKFVDELKNEGDLNEIDDAVDPDLELAAITRLVCEKNEKAPLFNNVIGAKDGLFRVLGASGALSSNPAQRFSRVAHHVGLPPSTPIRDIIRTMNLGGTRAPVPPVIVESGPCKEKSISGDDIDLTKLPVPMCHQTDGGRYIQTYGVNIVGMPDGSWTNWSCNRAMVGDPRHLIGVLWPSQHIEAVYRAWKEKGQECPWALAFGVPPIAMMVSAKSIPEGYSEAEYAGAILGQPMELVKCDTNNLYVPATSEIVLEGAISITETGAEGPFGEMHGYSFLDESNVFPKFRVDKITYREKAILPICVSGRLTDETHTLIGIPGAAEILLSCQNAKLPVTDVFVPFSGQVTWVAILIDTVALREMKTNSVKLRDEFASVVFKTKIGVGMSRIILCGDDIDVYNEADVLWAFSTRCRPGMDETVYEDYPGFPLIPHMGRGSGPPHTGGKIVSDVLLPAEYTSGRTWQTADFDHAYPAEVKAKVLKTWSARGFTSDPTVKG